MNTAKHFIKRRKAMPHYHIKARNIATGAIVEFDRDDEIDCFHEQRQARKWCEHNGYELIEIVESQHAD